MRRAAALLILLAACGKKDDSVHPAAASDAAAAAVKPAPAADAAVDHPGAKLSVAPLPVAATADYCAKAGDYALQTLGGVARQANVPAAKADQVAKDLETQWLALCSKDKWPKFVVDCFEKAPADVTTYQRCIDRLPAPLRESWDAQTDAIFGKVGVAGPKHPAHGGTAPPGSVAFEDLCGTYVAEVARLDDCNGGGMYIPAIEAVIREGRVSEVGGLIPPDSQPAIKKLCDDTTVGLRDVESKVCPNLQ